MTFNRLVRAEWTKLRSVRRWMLALGAAAVLTVAFSAVVSSGGTTDQPKGIALSPDQRPVSDDFHFMHRTLIGEGSLTVRVTQQADSHPDAMAGIMVKNGTTRGASFASIALTPSGKIQMMADFHQVGVREARAPQWLRLVRTGSTVTTYSSRDASNWQRVGRVDVAHLPERAEIGLFVDSPGKESLHRSAGDTTVDLRDTEGSAHFANLRLTGSTGSGWTSADLAPNLPAREMPPHGTTVMTKGGVTLTGSGDIGPNEPADDPVQIGLFGTLAALLLLVPLGVIFMTSEYRNGMISATLTATPARARILAAKALVLGGVTLTAGLIASFGAFWVSQPLLRQHGFHPPWYSPRATLADPHVLRAVVGAGVFLMLLSLLGLGAGALLRRGAPAIAAVISATLLPMILGSLLPLTAARTLMLLTPAGGLAMQRAQPPTDSLVEPWSTIGPWAGFTVLGIYTVLALVAGVGALRRLT